MRMAPLVGVAAAPEVPVVVAPPPLMVAPEEPVAVAPAPADPEAVVPLVEVELAAPGVPSGAEAMAAAWKLAKVLVVVLEGLTAKTIPVSQ